jgi:hypothetical protein
VIGPSDFTDEELGWLSKIGRGAFSGSPPKEIADNLVLRGVADRTDLGLRITGLGGMVLEEARRAGLLRRQEKT